MSNGNDGTAMTTRQLIWLVVSFTSVLGAVAAVHGAVVVPAIMHRVDGAIDKKLDRHQLEGPHRQSRDEFKEIRDRLIRVETKLDKLTQK